MGTTSHSAPDSPEAAWGREMLTGCARALVEDDTRVRTFFEESLAGEGFDVVDADMPAGPHGHSAARVGADDYPGKPLSMSALVGPAFDKVLAAAQREAGWARTRLYEWLAPVVAGYLRARGVDDPDDLTSEAFVCVFSGCGSFRGDEAQFRSWVLRIAHCRLVDARRLRNRHPKMESLDSEHHAIQGVPTMATAEDEALQSLGTERMRVLLDTLTSDQRDVLALRLIAGLTVKEVAASLAKQPGAVKTLHRRALSALRRKLANESRRP